MKNLIEGIVVAVLVAGTFTATYVLTSQPDEPAVAAETEAAPILPRVAIEQVEPKVADPPLQWSEDEEEKVASENAEPPAEGVEDRKADQGEPEAEDAPQEPELDRAPESSEQ